MLVVFATRGTELLIVADNIDGAALALNEYCGTPTDERPAYSFTASDVEPCKGYALAPGYFPREVARVAEAFRNNRLFITRGF